MLYFSVRSLAEPRLEAVRVGSAVARLEALQQAEPRVWSGAAAPSLLLQGVAAAAGAAADADAATAAGMGKKEAPVRGVLWVGSPFPRFAFALRGRPGSPVWTLAGRARLGHSFSTSCCPGHDQTC